MLSLFIGILMTFYTSLYSQGPIKKSVSQNKTHQLDQYFDDYFLTRSKNLKSDSNDPLERLDIQLNDEHLISAHLIPADLLASDYVISFPEGNAEFIYKSDLATPYTGFVKGYFDSHVRLAVSNDAIVGYIEIDRQKYFIEPAQSFDKSLDKNIMVIYTPEQVKDPQEVSCAATAYYAKQQETRSNFKSSSSCELVELAIAMDYSYRQAFGGTQQAIDQTIAIMNMVAGDYENQFSSEIRFEIVEHFVSNCSTCDPWSSSVEASTVLNSFTSWGPGGFSQTHDIGQFWTDRNLCGNGDCFVAGLAWINAVCGSWRYHILENFTSINWQLRVLVSHEMGHNFGSHHDGGSGHIMAPSISLNTSTWSAQSISAINSAVAGYSCFEDCVTGSCSEITHLRTTNCTPGSPSTYDLIVELRHGGGGSSSSFDVHVNGRSFNFTWETSPQTVTIRGLEADGTMNNSISIAADDGSDSGCAGSGSYDEPSSGCNTIISEDFNDCSVPAGWTKQSTNGYSWNGGNPLVQYEWKFDDATRQFANYDDGSNASSLKTIDGTCMALMDDDIINHSLYTGNVTLQTPVYDMTGFDTVTLRFDYNFHPFEDGGKGANNSYFNVEVFDGVNWNIALSDNDSPCSWHNVWPSSCITEASLDLSAYNNASFQIRFVYSDGNDGSWTGMIALDNFELIGSVDQPGSACPQMIQITQQNPSGRYEARDMIMTMDSIYINSATTFAADSTVIQYPLEVQLGSDFVIEEEGCE